MCDSAGAGGVSMSGGRGGAPSTNMWGVYDGHAGKRCSKHCAKELHMHVCSHPAYSSDLVTAVVEGYRMTEVS